MFSFGGSDPLQRLTDQINRELKRIAGWETERRRNEILDQIAEQISNHWEMAAAYTNLVIAVGYAGFFTAWTTLGSNNHPRLFTAAGLLALVSLLVFILWEVLKMTALGLFMQSVIPTLDADTFRVHESLERIKRSRTNLNLWFARLWLPVLGTILAFGLSAAAIVVILFVMQLF